MHDPAQVLRAMRVLHAGFRVRLSPCAVDATPGEAQEGSAAVICVVLAGACTVTAPDDESRRLPAGELGVFPGGVRRIVAGEERADLLCADLESAERPSRAASCAGGDRIVDAALAAMQRHPDRDWTLEALAREAHTSRSVLSERFQQRLGTPPMHYLAQLRLQLAASLLTTSRVPLIRIAEDVGYQTDTAFSRAFRREFGEPPAAWRRSRATRAQAA